MKTRLLIIISIAVAITISLNFDAYLSNENTSESKIGFEHNQSTNYFTILQGKDWYSTKPNTGQKINPTIKYRFTTSELKVYVSGQLDESVKYHFSEACNFNLNKVGVVTSGKYMVYEKYGQCDEIETINNDILTVVTKTGRINVYESE
jgi:hypothetical protein